MKILVTGSNGFVGRNLCTRLSLLENVTLLPFDLPDTEEMLRERLLEANFVFHLAGINRPENPADFVRGNTDLTSTLLAELKRLGRPLPVVISSSIQAALDNPYGRSKQAAEQLVFSYEKETDAPVYVYRLPNVFGKWCRPHYNSVVATFCHNIARGLPIQINDAGTQLNLVYIDDVVEAFLGTLSGDVIKNDCFCTVPITYTLTLGQLAQRLNGFYESRQSLVIPQVGDALTAKLYATYLSHLPEDAFSYPLTMHTDARGSFTEFLRTPERGQVSVNVSRPGVTKGDHWHHTKNEKFLVVKGKGIIRFRRLGQEEILSVSVQGEQLQVVDIPPGYTHQIENTGEEDMVTIIWASELFDPERPDTYYEKVFPDPR